MTVFKLEQLHLSGGLGGVGVVVRSFANRVLRFGPRQAVKALGAQSMPTGQRAVIFVCYVSEFTPSDLIM